MSKEVKALQEHSMCQVPVKATYQIIDGKAVMVSAVYTSIPAKDIAEMLIRRLGKTPRPYGGDRKSGALSGSED